MNDFTKEELENIYDALGHLIKFHANNNLTANLELRVKIQSMIDNYGDSETVMVRGIECKLSDFEHE